MSERRRRVSVRRRPWLALGAGLLGLGAAVAIPLLAVAATHTLSDSTVGEIVTPTPIDNLPDTPAALVGASIRGHASHHAATTAAATTAPRPTIVSHPSSPASRTAVWITTT